MNIAITTKCDKGCEFCFTDEGDKKLDNEIPLGKIKEHISMLSREGWNNFNILGGEPTQYSQFDDLIEYLNNTSGEYKIISNLLCGSSKISTLKKMNDMTTFLVNGMELDKNNRMRLFRNNLEDLLSIHSRNMVGIALTVTDGDSEEEFSNYLDYLENELIFDIVGGIRIGIDLTSKRVIGNKKMGRIIDMILAKARIYRIVANFDCQVPICILSDKTIRTIYNNEDNDTLSLLPFSNCEGPVCDVLPTGDVIHCYPLDDVKIKSDVGKWKERLSQAYSEYEMNTPIECLECPYHNKFCNGLCKAAIKHMDK